MHAGLAKTITGSVLNRPGNKERSFVEIFRYLGHITLWAVEMIRILKNNSGGKVGNILVWKFSFAPIETKIKLIKS